jgi:hypothetical protein
MTPPPEPRRLIKLVHHRSAFFVTPETQHSTSVAPVPLPHFPLSLTTWMISLGEMFWQDRRRCLALTLVLDLSRGAWQFAVPTQRCGRKCARWDLQATDYAEHGPDFYIAGSFQMLIASDLFVAAKAIQPLDGIHLVAVPGRQGDACWAYLHYDGESRLADPAAILADDLQTTLRRYAHRLIV